MPKPNYAFAKRQRELAKKQKAEEKRQRKAAGPVTGSTDGDGGTSGPADAPPIDGDLANPAGRPGAAAQTGD